MHTAVGDTASEPSYDSMLSMAAAAVGAAVLTSCTVSYGAYLLQAPAAQFARWSRWGSLAFATVQNSVGTMLLRYSRWDKGCASNPASVLVLYSELLKLASCLAFFCVLWCTQSQAKPSSASLAILKSVIATVQLRWPLYTLAVPALCYTIQNNLQFLAAAHASAVMIHLLERAKLFTTALFGVWILGRHLKTSQWMLLGVVTLGVGLSTDHREGQGAGIPSGSSSTDWVGVTAALLVSGLSGFSGVYLEKVLKSDDTHLAVRNLQLCFFTVPLSLFNVLVCGNQASIADFHSVCPISWLLVVNLALAGFLVSAIMRYSDNNLKGLAQSFATILTALSSLVLFDLEPSVCFVFGCVLVIGGSFAFNKAQTSDERIAVIGSGGHGKVILSALHAAGEPVLAVFDDSMSSSSPERWLNGVQVLALSQLPPDARAIVAIGNNVTRMKVVQRFPRIRWATVTHPSAVVDPTATFGEGTVVLAGAVVQANTTIGRHVVINTGSTVDHDCHIRDFVSISPGATLCGAVIVDERAWVGAGATVRQGVHIAVDCTVGAGSTIVRSMDAPDETWVGVPGRRMHISLGGVAPLAPEQGHTAGSGPLQWCWPKRFDAAVLAEYLRESVKKQQFTNHGPCVKQLEHEAASKLLVTKHVTIAVASGTAALHAMLATYLQHGVSMESGILVSAFGFPPILQGNWRSVARVVDVDPKHGGPILPLPGEAPPSVICLVNPFGYCVDVRYYRHYCDAHSIMLWMDNASTPHHLLPDGQPLINIADAVAISLHETKAIGRGEGGLLPELSQHSPDTSSVPNAMPHALLRLVLDDTLLLSPLASDTFGCRIALDRPCSRALCTCCGQFWF